MPQNQILGFENRHHEPNPVECFVPVSRCWSGLLYWRSAWSETEAVAAEPAETWSTSTHRVQQKSDLRSENTELCAFVSERQWIWQSPRDLQVPPVCVYITKGPVQINITDDTQKKTWRRQERPLLLETGSWLQHSAVFLILLTYLKTFLCTLTTAD